MTLSLGQFRDLLTNYMFTTGLDEARSIEARQPYSHNDMMLVRRVVDTAVGNLVQAADPAGDMFVVKHKVGPSSPYAVVWLRGDWDISTERRLETKLAMLVDHEDLRRRYQAQHRIDNMARKCAAKLSLRYVSFREVLSAAPEELIKQVVTAVDPSYYEAPEGTTRPHQGSPQGNPQDQGAAHEGRGEGLSQAGEALPEVAGNPA
jgi:hypothetical protein